MAEIRRCEGPGCGAQYVAQRATSKYCSTRCRVAATRSRKRGDVVPLPAASSIPAAPVSTPSVLVSVTAKLEAAGVTGEPAAAAALNLACRVDVATDSSAPRLTQELSRLMAEALAGAESAGDKLDETKARRDAKYAAARASAG